VAQGAGQRAAEIGDAEPFDPVIGAQPQPDDRVLGVRVFREAGERLVIRLGVAESPSADAPGGWALTLLLQRPAWIANGDNWWVFDRPMPAWTTST